MPGERHVAIAVALLAPLLAGVTCGITDVDVEERTLTAELRGDQVVPPVETAATGSATARLFGNNLAVQGNFSGLASAVLPESEGAVLLRQGAEGEDDGAIIFALPAASVDGRTGSFSGQLLIDDGIVDLFLEGLTYVEIRTEDHPDGELRAQLR